MIDLDPNIYSVLIPSYRTKLNSFDYEQGKMSW